MENKQRPVIQETKELVQKYHVLEKDSSMHTLPWIKEITLLEKHLRHWKRNG